MIRTLSIFLILIFSISIIGKQLKDDEYKAILMYGEWTVYTGKSKSHIRPQIGFEKEDKCHYINVGQERFEGSWNVKGGRLIIKKEDEENCVLPSGSYWIDYKPFLLKGEIKMLEIKLTSSTGRKVSLKSQIE